MMKSECRNSERNEELKTFDKDGKQIIGRRVGRKKKENCPLEFFKEGSANKRKRRKADRTAQTGVTKRNFFL
jgi:hypothetical protein